MEGLDGKGLRPPCSSEISHHTDRRSPSKDGLSEDSHTRPRWPALVALPCCGTDGSGREKQGLSMRAESSEV